MYNIEMSGKLVKMYAESKMDIKTDYVFHMLLKKIDRGIRKTVLKLWAEGLDTFWTCASGKGHLCSRPTVIISNGELYTRAEVLEKVVKAMEGKRYWLSETWCWDTPSCGMQLFWMLQFVSKGDLTGYPISFKGKRRFG